MPGKPVIIGITGGIGTGKSAASAMLAAMGCVVHSADRAVHDILVHDKSAIKQIRALAPTAVKNNRVSRKLLGKAVFGHKAKLKKLERILHPRVRAHERAALARARKAKRKAVVLDIPLLFETRGEKRCDIVIVTAASAKVQQARVLARPGMTPAKLKAIRARQLPEAEKRARADYVVRTDVPRPKMRAALKHILTLALQAKAR